MPSDQSDESPVQGPRDAAATIGINPQCDIAPPSPLDLGNPPVRRQPVRPSPSFMPWDGLLWEGSHFERN